MQPIDRSVHAQTPGAAQEDLDPALARVLGIVRAQRMPAGGAQQRRLVVAHDRRHLGRALRSRLRDGGHIGQATQRPKSHAPPQAKAAKSEK